MFLLNGCYWCFKSAIIRWCGGGIEVAWSFTKHSANRLVVVSPRSDWLGPLNPSKTTFWYLRPIFFGVENCFFEIFGCWWV